MKISGNPMHGLAFKLHQMSNNFFCGDTIKLKKLELAPVTCEENSSCEDDINEPFLLEATTKVYCFFFLVQKTTKLQ